MPCKSPYMKGLLPCDCGGCLPCRIKKRKMWTNRLLMEKDSHTHAAFVTLTYHDAEVVDAGPAEWSGSRPVLGTLVPEHVRNWLKRFRKMVAPNEIRYFLVGEYGDRTQRPHYHAAVFGFPPCLMGRTRRNRKGEAVCCYSCKTVEKTWGLGRIDVGELNKTTAEYIAGYVTKKWTREDQWTSQKLKGRHPEFVRMSLKPGIGAVAVKNLITFSVGTRREKFLRMCFDAPAVLKRNGSPYALGKYLRRKWREYLGRDPDTPKQQIEAHVRELQRVYEEDKAAAVKEGIPRTFCDPKFFYTQKTAQRIRNLEARSKIYTKEKTL